jgi:hypothetical protein
MMADELNINVTTIPQILREDLRKRMIYAKFVTHRPTDEQQQWRLTSCQDLVPPVKALPIFFIAFSVNTVLNEKRSLDAEDKGNVMAELKDLFECTLKISQSFY